MSTNKKRKLTIQADAPHLSAVAARRLKSQAESVIIANDTIKSPDISLSSGSTTPISPKRKKKLERQTKLRSLELEEPEPDTLDSELNFKLDSDGPDIFFESRAESPDSPAESQSMTLTTLKPSNETLKGLSDGTILVRLGPGERLVILGQYGISVQRGQITLMGSTLPASNTVYRVFAPSSHSLPVIRCLATDVNNAEIRLHQYETGLESLYSLSPLFGKLWNDGAGSLGSEFGSLLQYNKKSSFQILFSSKDGPQKSFLQPLISPPEWNEALSKFSVMTSTKIPSIMLCGPKSSGKSTFAKTLSNRLLSISTGARQDSKAAPGVAILDLDPGQPEFTPPGQVSLVYIQEPNFGPPFSHSTLNSVGSKSSIIRSHALGAISPALDPSFYMACALDLFKRYRAFRETTPYCPLIINTPGWVLGTGLEILVDLIKRINPTEVIYMSLDGPVEVVESLNDANRSTPIFTLPSQGSEYATRTAAHLRTMQTMSYFHHHFSTKSGLTWSDIPLTSIPPWQINYSGESAGILGIMCYGEQPPPTLLADSINGSLAAVIVIDDKAAIPGWDPDEQSIADDDEMQEDVAESRSGSILDTELRVFDEEALHPLHLKKPTILRTPKEDLPYFNPANSISIDPTYSHTIGLALIRGIDVVQHRLQILTAISPSAISETIEAGKQIVLVSGKLDTPGWAYTEEFIQRDWMAKTARQDGNDLMEANEVENERFVDQKEELSFSNGFQNAPWVEKLLGSEGRGVGSRVWRVRRDLGRAGEGDR